MMLNGGVYLKRFLILIAVLICLVIIAGCKHVETDYPAAIMVNGQIYHKSIAEVSGEVDDSAIIGHTTSYTDTYPQKDGETNFSREIGLPYAAVEEGIAILCDGEWYICLPYNKK